MTPMEWAIALLICWWVLRGGLADLVAAARGGTPARVAAGRARARGGGRYGAGAYLADLWSDSWRTARARREARTAGRLEAIRDGSAGPTWRQRAADRWSGAWSRWESRMATRWQERRDREGRPAPEPVTPDRNRPEVGEPRAGGEGRPGPEHPDGGRTQERQDQDQAEPDGRREPVEPVTITPWHPDQERQEPQELAARPGPGGRWEVVDDPDPRESQQDREKNHERGDDDMAEVTGLASALAHATEMRQAYEGSAAGAETYVASLQAGGVQGTAVDAVARAMEAQQQAAAAWGEAEAELQRHMQVREAYEANQGAGSREFLTSE